MIKHIQAGILDMSFSGGEERLDSLIDFASRENPKRGFLFVSKVLGKHIPVDPGVMRAIYNELADLCCVDDSVYVVGMSETATGLGAGVADSISRKNRECEVFYQHTTRHILDCPTWFTLKEAHSHAVDHIMYQPNDEVYLGVMSVKKLILVDDEITTGRTLFLLASLIKDKITSINEVVIITLANWMNKDNTKKFDDLGVSIKFVQLMKGRFTFMPDPEFKVRLPENIDNDVCKAKSRDDLGRTGLKMPYELDCIEVTSNKSLQPVVIVGTGEHLYYPFLLAERLAEKVDVVFQSTTRSPILRGDAVKRKIRFDIENGKVNFIYNLPKDRKVLVVSENETNYLLLAAQEEGSNGYSEAFING
jgi:hypothetical protein